MPVDILVLTTSKGVVNAEDRELASAPDIINYIYIGVMYKLIIRSD